ncbi:MAG: sialate O-acetylesterase, partial [Muribaculaceae bacterium]|nr:sialate O-acetylesterase [Muribaculaceae bacterium]
MKIIFKSIAVALAMICATALATFGKEAIRVACVGNSITYGTGVEPRETMNYPTQLGRMLGDGYEVGNFGHPGATLLKKGHNPYMSLPEFRAALDFKPDIAVIHLGINDTDPRNWPQYGDEFVTDYLSLIDSLKSVNPNVRVIIAELTPIAAKHRRFKSGTRLWRDIIRDVIADVADIAQVELIDFNTPLRDRQNIMPDGLHPNAEGATLLAQTAYGAITGNYGGLSLPPVYGDGMVLQRYKPLTINGRADAGAKINITIGDNSATAVTDNNGNWSATLAPMSEATGLTMTVSDGKSNMVFNDVAVGEVWLASGQSNMEFQLRYSNTFATDTITANDPLLRLYNMRPRVPTNSKEWAEADKDSVDRLVYYLPTKWQESTPSSAANFSAAGWHFGKMLRDSLNVPVGIICNAIGGSNTESWIDIETLQHALPEALLNWRKNDYVQPWAQKRAGEN